MTYAGDTRPILDADSHVMELPGFLDEHIERDMLDKLRFRDMAFLADRLEEAQRLAEARRTEPEARARADERLLLDKGWHAVGASDPAERSHALDLFGFQGQLVFATFANAQFVGKDL